MISDKGVYVEREFVSRCLRVDLVVRTERAAAETVVVEAVDVA